MTLSDVARCSRSSSVNGSGASSGKTFMEFFGGADSGSAGAMEYSVDTCKI